MKVLLIRHGQPDYSEVTERGYIGHGRDLGPLTALGKQQAYEMAKDARLEGVQLIVSSPYTRALQTAAILSRVRDLDIEVEVGLHEWMPDLTYTYSSHEQAKLASHLCRDNKGICPPDSPVRYEELSAVFDRANAVLQKYLSYDKIAVVCHATVMRQFAFAKKIPYCQVVEIDYHKNYAWGGFIVE